MNSNSSFPGPTDPPDSEPRRLYLREPGWRIGSKVGSIREFCYMMAPGQDYYHRLSDGELYVQRGDERLCLACAERRGLLDDRPKALREVLSALEFDISPSETEFDDLMDDFDWPT